MKKLNLSLIAILIAAGLLPQAVFSMEQPTGQNQNTDQIVYHANDLRTINGRKQFRIGIPRKLADGTTTIDYEWTNFNRLEEPCAIVRYTRDLPETYNR